MKTIFTVDPRLPQMISTICLEINSIVQSEEFYQILNNHKEKFPQSNIDGPLLASEFQRVIQRNLICQVLPYTYPWYKTFARKYVTAFVQAPRIRVINLNSMLIKKRSDIAWSGTIGHEFVHVIDNHSPYFFGHGDNDSSGDEGTATEFVGRIISGLYNERRYKHESMAINGGTRAYNEFMKAFGITGDLFQEFSTGVNNRPVTVKGVHEYGEELGPASKNSYHVAD